MTNNQPTYLTTIEAADYLRVSRQFLEIARHRGSGPTFIKLGRAVRYHRPTLDQWMLERQGEAAAAKSSLADWHEGYLNGMAIGARLVGSAGLGDKGAEIITKIADHIVMLGGLTDDCRAHEYAFWHVEGLEASEAEQEAARKIYERPDGKPVADAELLAELRGRLLAKAEQPENATN